MSNSNDDSLEGDKVTMGYDLISPYSFLAYQLHQNRYQHPKPSSLSSSDDDGVDEEKRGEGDVGDNDLNWDYLPVPIRDLFKLAGNVPPLESNKNKIQYLRHDIKNTAEYAKVPMKMHPRFPINTRMAMRILSYLRLNYSPRKYQDSLKVLWEGFYYHQKDIDHIEVIQDLLSSIFTTDEDELSKILSKSHDQDQDRELDRNTQFLNGKGAYGLPYFIAESSHPTDGVGRKELCQFGSDRIPLLYQFFNRLYPNIHLNPIIDPTTTPFSCTVTMAFDILSPYCYFARRILQRYEKDWEIEIDYQPVHMATIFEESGNVGPIFGCENKRQYTFRDLEILPKFYDVEFRLPTKFPTDTKLIMTIITLIKSELSSEKFRKVVDTIWDGYYVNNLDVEDPDTIRQLLTPILHPIDPCDLLEKAAVNFDRILTRTKELVHHHGAHGLPYFIVTTNNNHDDQPAITTTTNDDQPITSTNDDSTTTTTTTRYYFGSDKFPLLAHALNRTYSGPHPNS